MFASNGALRRWRCACALSLITHNHCSAAADNAELDSHKVQRHSMFDNVGPGYYGEEDEADGELLKYEQEAEAEGEWQGCSRDEPSC